MNREQQNTSFVPLVSPKSDHFNFEIWASVVKRQMIAALQKKTVQRS